MSRSPAKKEINNIENVEIKREKLTTTKKILWLSWVLFIILIVMNAFGIDTGVAMEIVGGIVTSVVSVFYLWKSKCENRVKIAYGMVSELADKYGIENVIPMLETVLRD